MYKHIIDNVPNYTHFLSVEEMDASSRELAEKYPDIVEIFEAGQSEKGRSIYCLKIGNGLQNAFLYGCPHPNEPIGAMMLEYFSACLAGDEGLRNELGYTWYIIKCCDPDGTMLNEGWFRGPFTLGNYGRNFFRQASNMQIDWTFPVKYKKLDYNKPLRETKALMKVIDEARPVFVYPLHNSGFGGAYWYITRPIPGLCEKLSEVAARHGIPLSLGEPEAPYSVMYGPAVYKALSMKDEYDYLEKYGEKDPSELIKCGTCGEDYAVGAREDGKVFGLVAEVPYYYDKRVSDLSQSELLRYDLAVELCSFQKELYREVLNILSGISDLISADNPFAKTVGGVAEEALEGVEAKRKMVEKNTDFQRKATVSEAFDYQYASRFYNLLSVGMLVRTAEYELARLEGIGKTGPELLLLKKAFEAAEALFNRVCSALEEDMNYTVIPIRQLVRVQLESGLLAASTLRQQE
ncbi:MAG TPA: M14 family zinc carboxypeptidase [Clostridia bacterium]|nr:M14 family zinc carboxypeptidase [Clostridia bacterium]